ncbi:ATP-binding protein [Azospirillum sp. B506]|uniref:hybrid sensor histidine kinase/response regulator n=1 Tax=Azospirillum sp. B506 TaxID=137721 RepID=UPI00034AE36A|nr:ATP-binding protein [Azospirillum sp. B506]
MRPHWIAAALLPLAAYALLLLVTVNRLQQEIIRTNLEDELEHTSASVQQLIQHETSFLSGLTLLQRTATDTASGEIAEFEARARLARQLHPSILAITLRDRKRTIFNVGGDLPGSAAEQAPMDMASPVWTSGVPEVGDLSAGAIPLEIPILRDGRVAYVLTGLIDPRMFNDLLRSAIGHKGWVAALLDRSLSIVGRSEQGETFVGTSATPDLVDAIRAGRTGIQQFLTKEGRPSYVVITALGTTGWRLAMAIPIPVAEQTYRPFWLRFLANGGLILLALVVAASVLVWRKVRRLEARTETLSSGLARANRESDEKSAFMAMISHELRTPLTGILGFSELLAKSPLAPVQKEWLKLQVSSGRILLNVINDILDYSKIEGGHVTLESVEFEVRGMVERCIALVEPMASAKGLGLQCDFSLDATAWVKGDPMRLQQVIGNLLNNAVKFTKQGEVHLSVSLKPTAMGQATMHVSIRDTGIGIPADRHDRLFKRFSQADDSTTRTYGGTGLGLAVCKGLVEMMGGSIGFDSLEGQGSSFHFTVPLPMAHPRSEDADAPPQKGIRPPAGSRILVVEDNPITRTLTRTVLEQAGYGVSVAGTGEEALATVGREALDLVLMDVHLPGMGGPDATRAIRAMTGDRSRIPVLALTADAFHDDVANCLASGMDGHIAKPFRIEDLLQAIAAHLQSPDLQSPDLPDTAPDMQTVIPAPEAGALQPRPGSIAAAVGTAQATAMIRMFIGTVKTALTELAEARNSPRDLYEVSHRMVGAAGMFGFTEIVVAARTLCLACRSEQPDRYRAALGDLQTTLQDFLRQVPVSGHEEAAED